MLYPTDGRPAADVLVAAGNGGIPMLADPMLADALLADPIVDEPTLNDTLDDPALAEAAVTEAGLKLRALIMAGERYRLSAADSVGLGSTESQAISYLAVHGARGQSELARDLSLTSSAATALVDRLERHGAAERARHPSDRRRTIIRLTDRGAELAAECQQPLLASLGLVPSADLQAFSTWLGVVADDLHARTR